VQSTATTIEVLCDCCPEKATRFYRTYARNNNEGNEYYALCKDHCDPDDGGGEITLDEYVVGCVMES
jgi:hypothetical protein